MSLIELWPGSQAMYISAKKIKGCISYKCSSVVGSRPQPADWGRHPQPSKHFWASCSWWASEPGDLQWYSTCVWSVWWQCLWPQQRPSRVHQYHHLELLPHQPHLRLSQPLQPATTPGTGRTGKAWCTTAPGDPCLVYWITANVLHLWAVYILSPLQDK